MSALVSICIPNYNMDRFLKEAIKSALDQTYRDVEVVVVDNDSTDGSGEIIESFSGSDRFLCFSNDTNIGMVRNWNRCLDHSKGKYVVMLSADDALGPTFVEECMKLQGAFENLGYVTTEASRFNGDGASIETTDFYSGSAIIKGFEEARLNLMGCHTNPTQMLIKRSCLNAVGGFDERYGWAFDIDLMIKLNLGYDVGYIKKRLCRYRVHPAMSSASYFDTKLGVMEKYMIKMEILEKLPAGMEGLGKYKGKMVRGIAETCLGYSEKALSEKNFVLAREYLDLAFSFSGGIRADYRSSLIDLFIENNGRQGAGDYAKFKKDSYKQGSAPMPGPPYDLPEGSLPLDL